MTEWVVLFIATCVTEREREGRVEENRERGKVETEKIFQ